MVLETARVNEEVAMIQIVLLIFLILFAMHWKIALIVIGFLYYFGWPFDPIAQMVEQFTFNEWVASSSLAGITT